MKSWIKIGLGWLLCYLLNATSISSTAQHHELRKTENFGDNPGNLEMYSYIPGNLNGQNHPLVVVLHGCTQSAGEVAEQTGWNKLADSLNFFVLYPQTAVANNITSCFRWFSEIEIATNHGESASIYQMISRFREQYPVDSSRIFITGLSAGGAMAVVMMARFPELFSSGAIVAGGPYGSAWRLSEAKKAMRGKVKRTPREWGDMVRSQNPGFAGSYPRISIFHGEADKTVHPANADYLMAQWTNLHGTDQTADNIHDEFRGHPKVDLREFVNHRGDSVVRWYVLKGVKHELMIDPGDAIDRGGKTGKYAVDAGFHIPWQCAVDFGLTETR